MHLLNRAIATAEHKSPKAGLTILKSADIPQWFSSSYHWYAELAPIQKVEQLLNKRFHS